MTPTVGSDVWYRAPKDGSMGAIDQPLAAIVVSVLSDERVNLAVFDSSGTLHQKHNVLLVQGEEEVLEGTCCLVLYQRGQTAKTEALKAQLQDQQVPEQVAVTDEPEQIVNTIIPDEEVKKDGEADQGYYVPKA